jgi:predicted phage terminase large subunit-like protein
MPLRSEIRAKWQLRVWSGRSEAPLASRLVLASTLPVSDWPAAVVASVAQPGAAQATLCCGSMRCWRRSRYYRPEQRGAPGAGLLLGRDRDGIFYVIDVVRAQLTTLGVQKLVRRTAEEDRELAAQRDWLRPVVRMEQEPGGAGKAIVDIYSREVLDPFDFRGVSSSGSKEARAAPVAARAEAGHLMVCRGAWNGDFLDEVCAFPSVRHDDQVDALSGAYAVLAHNGGRGHARITTAIIGEPPSRPGWRRGFDDPQPPPPPWERGGRSWHRG